MFFIFVNIFLMFIVKFCFVSKTSDKCNYNDFDLRKATLMKKIIYFFIIM